MRVLVTGGCGFLGAAFAARARATGLDVVTLDVHTSANCVCNLADADRVARAVVDSRTQAIVHLAARLTDAGERDPVDCVRINALCTAALFAAAETARVERVIYAGSIAAVGDVREGGDDVALAPGSVYGATKAFGEHLARAMSARPSAPAYLTLRFGWVYGPGRVRGWRTLQDLLERVVAGERNICYPDYPDPIDWTWVDDAAEVLLRSLAVPLPRYALHNALGDKRTVREAIAHLARRFPDLVALPEPAATPPSGWRLSNSGLERLIGYAPRTRLEDGIDRMLAAATEPVR